MTFTYFFLEKTAADLWPSVISEPEMSAHLSLRVMIPDLGVWRPAKDRYRTYALPSCVAFLKTPLWQTMVLRKEIRVENAECFHN